MTVDHATACPWCRYVCDRATQVPKAGTDLPVNGDFSLCLKCGEWSIFDSFWVGGLRKPKHEEYVEIVKDPDCGRARAAWVMMNGGGHVNVMEAGRKGPQRN